MRIGTHTLPNNLVLAPMAGVTDRPFRQLCRELGAGLVVSEMVSANTRLWNSRKTQLRLDHVGECEPVSVQIAGADPEQLAHAARVNVERGAQIIDINMGCPAKKVCNVMAGSALLQDEALVTRVLSAVVNAVPVPVTLKIRSGWDPAHRNGVRIARIAEAAGIQALAVHGRTRACAFAGPVEHDTVRAIKAAVTIPVIANGDITTPQQARAVLDYTGADGIMVGRAAQGRPWIFREIAHYLATGEELPPLSTTQVCEILLTHVVNLHAFYGAFAGVRIARKHISWYCRTVPGADSFRRRINPEESPDRQLRLIAEFFANVNDTEELAA